MKNIAYTDEYQTRCKESYAVKVSHNLVNTEQIDYLLFRIDLYGYSVYDVYENRHFFYVPDTPETFIWTDMYYNFLRAM